MKTNHNLKIASQQREKKPRSLITKRTQHPYWGLKKLNERRTNQPKNDIQHFKDFVLSVWQSVSLNTFFRKHSETIVCVPDSLTQLSMTTIDNLTDRYHYNKHSEEKKKMAIKMNVYWFVLSILPKKKRDPKFANYEWVCMKSFFIKIIKSNYK